MAVVWLLLGGLLVALLWTFGAQNGQSVDMQYFGLRVLGAPLWTVAVVPAVLGLLLGFLSTLPGRVRGMVATRRLRRQVQERDRTIGELQRLGGAGSAPPALPDEAGVAGAGDGAGAPDAATRSRLWR